MYGAHADTRGHAMPIQGIRVDPAKATSPARSGGNDVGAWRRWSGISTSRSDPEGSSMLCPRRAVRARRWQGDAPSAGRGVHASRLMRPRVMFSCTAPG